MTSSESLYRLSRSDYESGVLGAFRDLREEADLFDITLGCSDAEGRFLQAHKVILSASSGFFRKMFKQQEVHISSIRSFVFLKGISFVELAYILDYMYQGEVSVKESDLDSFMSVSEDLEIDGLRKSNEINKRSSQKDYKIVPEATQDSNTEIAIETVEQLNKLTMNNETKNSGEDFKPPVLHKSLTNYPSIETAMPQNSNRPEEPKKLDNMEISCPKVKSEITNVHQDCSSQELEISSAMTLANADSVKQIKVENNISHTDNSYYPVQGMLQNTTQGFREQNNPPIPNLTEAYYKKYTDAASVQLNPQMNTNNYAQYYQAQNILANNLQFQQQSFANNQLMQLNPMISNMNPVRSLTTDSEEEHFYKTAEGKEWQCKHCDTKKSSKQLIKDHMYSVHFQTSEPCIFCHKMQRGGGSLRNHMYACARKMGKKFTSKTGDGKMIA